MSPVDNLKSAKGFLPAMKRSKRSLALQLCIESYHVGKLELCLLCTASPLATMGKKLKRVSAPRRHVCEDVTATSTSFLTLGFSAVGPGRQCRPIHDKDTGNAQVASQAISFQVSAPSIKHGAGHQNACLNAFLQLDLEVLTTLAKRSCDFPGACASSKAFTQESPRRRARARTRRTTTPRISAS